MNTEIKYKDGFGNIITEEQQKYLTEYEKITYEMNQIKMIEYFKKHRGIDRKTVDYFLSSDKDKNDILQKYSDPVNHVRCILYFNNQIANNFNLWDWESYSEDAQITFKGKIVYDSKHRLIFYCSFNLLTNKLDNGAWKNYYGNIFENEHDDKLLIFDYDNNGDIDWIIDIKEKFGYTKGISLNQYLADTDFSQVDFPWDKHPYYHTVTPYLPTGDL